MDTLSSAVAEVVRRELAGRQIDDADFAKTVNMPKTTAWRKIRGASKMSIDDVAAFAAGLGWSLPEMMDRADALRRSRPGDEDPLTPKSGAGKRALAEGRASARPSRRTRKGSASTG